MWRTWAVIWMDAFRPFSITHAGVVATFAVVMSLVVLAGQSVHEPRRRARAEQVAGALVLFVWAAVTAWGLMPGRFDAAESLPLHLCDIAAPIAGLSLLTRARSLSAIVYFWGLGLNSQAFITPLLRAGPAHLVFWTFWGMHFIIVGTAFYDLFVRGFRPAWKDYGLAVAAAAAYLALVLPINVAFGFNYGYIGDSRPDRATVIDLLGPWPWRVIVIATLVCIVMGLLLAPWELGRRLRNRRHRRGP